MKYLLFVYVAMSESDALSVRFYVGFTNHSSDSVITTLFHFQSHPVTRICFFSAAAVICFVFVLLFLLKGCCRIKILVIHGMGH